MTAIWKEANVDIRKGMPFETLMKEQNYEKISFEEFIAETIGHTWGVTLEELLEYSN